MDFGLRSTCLCNFHPWTPSPFKAPNQRRVRVQFFERAKDAGQLGKTLSLRQRLKPFKCEASLEPDSNQSVLGTLNEQVSSSRNDSVNSSSTIQPSEHTSLTGGAFDFRGATEPLTSRSLSIDKKVVLVRHGLSSWNAESRIQGSSDLSVLSDSGALQAEKCREALSNFKFDGCFASPISRAKSSAELIWSAREEPLLYLNTLREANLLFLEGMKNVDAQKQYPQLYKAWREDPVNFNINGIYPVVNLWDQAKKAWKDILSSPGQSFLVVSHKSILRALICTALGMGPDRFRAIDDINNGGISIFVINKRGEPMLKCLNMTTHLYVDDVRY